MLEQKPIFKVFFLKESQEEFYSSRLLLELKKVLGDSNPFYEKEALQTINGIYADKEIQVDVISRCSTAFAQLSDNKSSYNLIILPNHGSCFTSQLVDFCKKNERTACADQIIISESGPLLKWSTRKDSYDINQVSESKDRVYVNIVEGDEDFLINTILGFIEKIEISISYDKDFNRAKIEKLNSILRNISPFIETRQQAKNTLGKDVIIQIMSPCSVEKSAMIEIDECKIYFNCSNSFINFTKGKLKSYFNKIANIESDVVITYNQLQKEVISLVNNYKLKQFNSALSAQEDTAKKVSSPSENDPSEGSHLKYYKGQIREVKKVIAKGVSSKEKVQIQNILETIDRRELHKKSENAVKLAFISYAHVGKNKEHVWTIANHLICEGVDIRIDQYYNNPGDWKKWMENHISASNHVIQFFSHFNHVVENFPNEDRGRGILFEAEIIDGEKYRRDLHSEKKFIYVLHDDDDHGSEDHLPLRLRNTGHSVYRYPSQLDDILSYIKGINLS